MSYNKPVVQIPAELFNWIKQYQGSQNGMIELTGCILQLNKNLVGRNEKQHPTEEKYPEQVNMFRNVIEKMYQTHLEKNADYSPMNILSTGIVGLATRIWDKTARILNLLGFNLQTGEFSHERMSAKDESIEDNLLDLAVYCIIALIYRAGKWGK